MRGKHNYWTSRVTRRRVVGGAAAAGVGAAGLALVGCGDDDNDGSPTQGSTPQTTPAAPGSASPTAPSGEQPVRGGTLRTGTFLNVLGIDPHIEVSVGLSTAIKVYTYLGAYDSVNAKYNLILAEALEQPTPTEFTFKLRKGVKFQNIAPVNGRDVVADDVKYSMERFRDLPQAQGNDFWKTIVDKMEVIDPNTFKITTKQPYAEAFAGLGASNGFGVQTAVVAKEDVEKRGDLTNGGVGAGPYIIDEYVKGERTVLKRNPDYWDKNLPYLDKWTGQTILDSNTLLQAYRSDQIDFNGAILTKLDFDDLQKNSKLVNTKLPALYYASFAMNASVKPFNDPRVRQAIYVGIDRGQFIDKVFQGEAQPMGPLATGLSFWALPQDQIKPYIGPDIKKAKELLTAAGYANGFDIDIETSNGVQFYIDHAEVLVSELKKIGINASLKLSDLSTYLSTKLFAGAFNTTVFSHNPYETPKTPLGFYHKNGIGNGSWWHYDNPKVTEALDKQNAEMDVQKRKQLVLDAQKLILDDYAPLLNFATPTQFISYHKRVGGYDPALRGYQGLRFSEYVKPNA